ncbi:MAG: fimbrial assembly protein [Zetaproteobacteria bacterium CG06_land_8_20_14_3_00_59_53]|nr:MAG: hypothetical protein AUK36_06260 [Zetaproteobacteria bacterium CG2_30_59_37]PIO90649.1 MAG: fimbrial assembly protein [Zetaproteobacteria bacterium CG23_combo_of_CG06-09_8_20_14_all_59_86]PIQ66087.1 MAG: fimbrial assembly protein [Zetaproteobacteria bacterium CG11_big_fil_rev_8_21_14_0_20_59_439]PIU71596.1 MAG: fimbrial assembly protein [Zetaproteobacteria bacterium CG06_land_8_20_14_3_00_59_53]PIU97857.1 MAG: fimbrial assembly protein [Zetaproteobacteria bacterium CG03_land_8_20_14_0_8
MIRINLLPYRDMRRRGQILKYILVALVGLIVTGLLLLASYSWTNMELSDAKNSLQGIQLQNIALKNKIGELSKFKEVQAEVQKKLELVDKLQRGRFRSLQSMQALSESIPKNVWLTRVTDNGSTISISGLGESNRAVSGFMRALEDQKVFFGVSLQVIKRESIGGVALRSFSLTMNRIDIAPPADAQDKIANPDGGKAS